MELGEGHAEGVGGCRLGRGRGADAGGMGTGRSQCSTGRSQRDKYSDFAARMDQAVANSQRSRRNSPGR